MSLEKFPNRKYLNLFCQTKYRIVRKRILNTTMYLCVILFMFNVYVFVRFASLHERQLNPNMSNDKMNTKHSVRIEQHHLKWNMNWKYLALAMECYAIVLSIVELELLSSGGSHATCTYINQHMKIYRRINVDPIKWTEHRFKYFRIFSEI